MNKLCLDGEDWKLIYVKNDRFQKDGISTDIQVLRNRGYDEIAATVKSYILNVKFKFKALPKSSALKIYRYI